VEELPVRLEVLDKGKTRADLSGEEMRDEDDEIREDETEYDENSDTDDELDLSESLKQSRQNAQKEKQKDEESFARLMEWKQFAATVQPNDQTRHEMALINIPLSQPSDVLFQTLIINFGS
jgi:hypothetical protein